MFECLLPAPPTANHLFPTGRNGRRFRSTKYTAWIASARLAMEGQHKPGEPMTGRLWAEYRYSFKDKRKRDIANFEKAISDFLNEIGVFEDDSQIDIMHLIREEPGGNSVFVTIKEI